jgi:hypothetical protein
VMPALPTAMFILDVGSVVGELVPLGYSIHVLLAPVWVYVLPFKTTELIVSPLAVVENLELPLPSLASVIVPVDPFWVMFSVAVYAVLANDLELDAKLQMFASWYVARQLASAAVFVAVFVLVVLLFALADVGDFLFIFITTYPAPAMAAMTITNTAISNICAAPRSLLGLVVYMAFILFYAYGYYVYIVRR